MPSPSSQLDLPFRSLDFPERRALAIAEISGRLGLSVQQVLDLINEGAFTGVDVGSEGAKRKTWRIPVESYRDFVVRRLNNPRRAELLRQLPRPVLEELYRDLTRILAA